jgi:ABC-type transport system involved in cytochrome c biogenesis permease subunit
MYSEPGPLMPILDTWWRVFHVSLLIGAMGIFAAGFVFNGLYLLRDTGERSIAGGERRGTQGAKVAAARFGDLEGDADDDGIDGSVAGRTTDTLAPGDDQRDQDAEHRAAVRAGVSPYRLAVGTFVGTSLVSWVFIYSATSVGAGMGRFLTINLLMVVAALLARWFVPFLPSSATLDGLAHRTIAFGFLMWTVGVIAGAMWAEQSWGRFWGWDPKETGAFLTWVAYAGYLHARATTGMKGRKAAWIGVGSFVVLMGTYLIANYVIVGLHSYAGLN